MKKLITILVFTGILGACGSSPKYVFDKEVFDKGEMAYIVVGADHNAKHKQFGVNTYINFKSTEGETIELEISEGSVKGFMIPAGNYELSSYILYGSQNYGRTTISINLDFEDKIEGNFNVKSGEALYLGHIDTQIIKVDKNLFKKIFNKGPEENDLTYTTVIKNEFDKMDKSKFEKEVGKKLKPQIMKWEKKQEN